MRYILSSYLFFSVALPLLASFDNPFAATNPWDGAHKHTHFEDYSRFAPTNCWTEAQLSSRGPSPVNSAAAGDNLSLYSNSTSSIKSDAKRAPTDRWGSAGDDVSDQSSSKESVLQSDGTTLDWELFGESYLPPTENASPQPAPIASPEQEFTESAYDSLSSSSEDEIEILSEYERKLFKKKLKTIRKTFQESSASTELKPQQLRKFLNGTHLKSRELRYLATKHPNDLNVLYQRYAAIQDTLPAIEKLKQVKYKFLLIEFYVRFALLKSIQGASDDSYALYNFCANRLRELHHLDTFPEAKRVLLLADILILQAKSLMDDQEYELGIEKLFAVTELTLPGNMTPQFWHDLQDRKEKSGPRFWHDLQDKKEIAQRLTQLAKNEIHEIFQQNIRKITFWKDQAQLGLENKQSKTAQTYTAEALNLIEELIPEFPEGLVTLEDLKAKLLTISQKIESQKKDQEIANIFREIANQTTSQWHVKN